MHHLPAGTVTMLFTDIEGSTHLLEQLDERYPDVLAQYRSLLRTTFHAHSGQEVDTQGDSQMTRSPSSSSSARAQSTPTSLQSMARAAFPPAAPPHAMLSSITWCDPLEAFIRGAYTLFYVVRPTIIRLQLRKIRITTRCFQDAPEP